MLHVYNNRIKGPKRPLKAASLLHPSRVIQLHELEGSALHDFENDTYFVENVRYR